MASPNLPKIISVYYRHKTDEALSCVSYILNAPTSGRKATLKRVIADLIDAFKLRQIDEGDKVQLTDVNGRLVKSYNELYCCSPSTLVLRVLGADTGDTDTGALVPSLSQCRGKSATSKHNRSAKLDGTQSWLFGKSKLLVEKSEQERREERLEQEQLKQVQAAQSSTKRASRLPRVANLPSKTDHSGLIADTGRAPATGSNKATNDSGKSSNSKLLSSPRVIKKKSHIRSRSKKAVAKSKDAADGSSKPKESKAVNFQENVQPLPEPERSRSPSTNSNEETSQRAQTVDRVKSLQDQMAEGQSFLDTIGRPQTRNSLKSQIQFDEPVQTKSQANRRPYTPSQPVIRRHSNQAPGWAIVDDDQDADADLSKDKEPREHYHSRDSLHQLN